MAVSPATSTRQPPIARIDHWGAPTAGLNAIDNVTAMQPTDAVRIDNWVCDTNNIRLRRGSVQYAALPFVPTSPVRSLMVYNGATTRKLLASGGGTVTGVGGPASVLDITRPDIPPGYVVVVGGLQSDEFEYVNFATPGGQFLVCVNGKNVQYIYDGTTWSTATNTWGTTGSVVTPTTFATIAAFENRLFFTAPTGLGLYYLPVNVFQGEIHMLDLGGYLPAGGVITNLGTWTRDNGFGGMDDLLIVVTDQGEVLSFSGIDPDLADGWNFIGRFVVGKPVAGHRALARLGPDLMLICEDGFQPLSRYLAVGQSQAITMTSPGPQYTTAISRRIGNAVTDAVKANKALFGWQAILYPANNVMLVNVPQPAGGGAQQFVVNTITGAWSRFKGLNAWCWAVFEGGIYFGSDNGIVVKGDTGGDDMGQPIAFDLVTSFQLLGGNAQQKRATMVRPFLTANGVIAPSLDVNVDYNIAAVSAPIATSISDTVWNGFNWDDADWAGDAIVQNNWFSVQGYGTAFAIHMSGQAKCSDLQLFAFDIAFESGVGFI